MDITHITPESVRHALDLVRRAEPLAGQPLLDLEALRAHLRAEGIAVNPTTLEWGLGGLLHGLIHGQLHRARGADTHAAANAAIGATAAAPPGPLSLPQEKALLAKDFAAANADREAWSSLYYRFVAGLGLQEKAIAEIARPGYDHADRHIRRRLQRGYSLLTDALRAAELAALRQADRLPGLPAQARIVVEPPARAAAAGHPSATPSAASPAPADDPSAAARILAALQDDSRVAVLAPDQAQALADASPDDWPAYRLGRIAAWSRPRYRLDTRFVDLALLVDQGPAVQGERWAAGPRTFHGLGDILAAVPDPVLVVLGPPGAGKSALLRRFELDAAIAGLRDEDPRLTFYLSLASMPPTRADDTAFDPAAWLAAAWQARFPRLPALDTALAEGRMVLLLDALNEMPHAGPADYRARVGGWKRFAQTLVDTRPGNRVVFACRSLDYSAPLSTPALPVPHVRIEPLSDAQIRLFLERHIPVRAAALWQALADSGRLDLVRLPYFLKLTLDEAGATGTLPAGRTDLFTRLVRHALARELARDNPRLASDRLLTERDRRRVAHDAWPTPHALPEHGRLIPALAELAYRMQDRHPTAETAQVRVPYAVAVDLLDDPDAEAILGAALDLGVLDEDTPHEAVQFFHQLLQEYFAARRLAAAPEPERVRAPWRAADVRPSLAEAVVQLAAADPLPPLPATGWEETAVLAAGMAADPDAFVAGVADVNLPVAARCAAEADRAVSPTRLAALRHALVARSRDPAADLRARIAAGLALGKLGDPRFAAQTGADGRYLDPPLVAIPAGEYPVGAADAGPGAAPAHGVPLAGFAIGAFAVTNAEWACFVAAGGYDDPRWWDTPAAAAWQRGDATAEGARWNYREWRRRFRADPGLAERMRAEGRLPPAVHEAWRARLAMSDEAFEEHLAASHPAGPRRAPEQWADTRFNHPAQPVVGVCWYEARAYCRWLAAQSGRPFRLPTEAEWEAAARGLAGRRFAFGDAFDPAACNAVETHVRRPTPVGVFPAGDTPEGAADLTGNVWEWTASAWGPDADAPAFGYPYRPDDGREAPAAPDACLRVARGGSWLNAADLLHAAYRYPFHPGHRNDLYGFRVALGPA